MFDCGEDTQRQVMATLTDGGWSIRYLVITRIFVTAMEGPRVHGLPGILCTLVRYQQSASQSI